MLRERIHPDAVAVYDWVQLERDTEVFIGTRSGVDHWLDDMAADQAFRHFMQGVAEAAGRPKQWPTNELTVVLTNDQEIRARARMNLPNNSRARTGVLR